MGSRNFWFGSCMDTYLTGAFLYHTDLLSLTHSASRYITV
jgi:hypothetical protein